MTVSRDDVVALIVDQRGHRPLTHRFMTDAEPLFAALDAGRIRLAGKDMLAQASVDQAIRLAVGRPVTSVTAVSMSRQRLHPLYARAAAYDPLLSAALFGSRNERFKTAHGAESLSRLVDPLWACFGEAYVSVMQEALMPFFVGAAPLLERNVLLGGLNALTYSLAYASRGDEVGYRQMAPLLKLLPWAVPIGALADVAGAWVVIAD